LNEKLIFGVQLAELCMFARPRFLTVRSEPNGYRLVGYNLQYFDLVRILSPEIVELSENGREKLWMLSFAFRSLQERFHGPVTVVCLDLEAADFLGVVLAIEDSHILMMVKRDNVIRICLMQDQ